MSDYNRQQREAILMVGEYLSGIPAQKRRTLEAEILPYLAFRKKVARFQERHFADVCSMKCFSDGTSACCGREGILVFFADVVVNGLIAPQGHIARLLEAIEKDAGGPNCVYLRNDGCSWSLKPVVCEMFLCDPAKERVFGSDGRLGGTWEELRQREKLFTKPTRPVLFDDLEKVFIEAGFGSPLMYLHRSPGLLRLKAQHGL